MSLPRAAHAKTCNTTIAIVVSDQSPIKGLSWNEVRRIFSGETFYTESMRLVPINHGIGSSLRHTFDRNVLEMDPDGVGRYWIDRKLRGLGNPPRKIPQKALLKRLLQKFPAAISYLDVGDMSAGLRALLIDGKAPSQRGYALNAVARKCTP